MLYSFKLLKRLANLPETTIVKDVVNVINSIGFEVEETYKFGDVDGIKFGKVLKTYQNPNSEKLTVCEIEFNDKKRTIQTTAKNVVQGMYIVAFVPDSRSGEITFGTKEMAGVNSEGMLSSLNELGANVDHIRNTKDIQEYPKVDLSTNPVEYLDLQDEIIDVDVLSNRSDANAHYVMARELAAYFNTKPVIPSLKQGKYDSTIKVKTGEANELTMVEAKEVNITLKDQMLLAKMNIKSINDYTDLTNLALIMTGQPVHAYDKNKVGNDFSSKLQSSTVKILGGKEVELKDNLVITSGKKVASIAGVMGLEETEVSDSTKEVVLELGLFNIKHVRNSLKTIKLDSKAGVQSSKVLGNGTLTLGLAYLSSKLINFSNPVNYKEAKSSEVKFDSKATSTLAGFEITKEAKYKKAIASLKTLGFKFSKDKVVIPTYRHDVTHQQDLDEEIFRFYGYDNFKAEAPHGVAATVIPTLNLKSQIAAQGYSEVTTYSLTSRKSNVINPFDFKGEKALETFVSKAREVIRSSQAISMLEVIEYNRKRKMEIIDIFSEGMIQNGEKSIILASTTKSFNELKTNALNILPEGTEFVRATSKTLHPGVSANIMLNNKQIGWIGKVHPSLTKEDVFMVEFFTPNTDSFKASFETYSNEPMKTVDITFDLSKGEDIADKIKNIKGAYSIKVIDKFQKDNSIATTIRVTADDELINKLK